MSEIKNPMAYFSTAIRNWNKTDYRSNDNFYKHISSVGDEHNIQDKLSDEKSVWESGSDYIETALRESSVENWLLFMENERLHKALSSLPTADIEFMFALSMFNFKCTDYAKFIGVSQQSISYRKKRIFKKILKLF